MSRKLRQASASPEQAGSDQLLALPCTLAGGKLNPKNNLVCPAHFQSFVQPCFYSKAPLVALTKSLGEVTSHAEDSLAALQVLVIVKLLYCFLTFLKFQWVGNQAWEGVGERTNQVYHITPHHRTNQVHMSRFQ